MQKLSPPSHLAKKTLWWIFIDFRISRVLQRPFTILSSFPSSLYTSCAQHTYPHTYFHVTYGSESRRILQKIAKEISDCLAHFYHWTILVCPYIVSINLTLTIMPDPSKWLQSSFIIMSISIMPCFPVLPVLIWPGYLFLAFLDSLYHTLFSLLQKLFHLCSQPGYRLFTGRKWKYFFWTYSVSCRMSCT